VHQASKPDQNRQGDCNPHEQAPVEETSDHRGLPSEARHHVNRGEEHHSKCECSTDQAAVAKSDRHGDPRHSGAFPEEQKPGQHCSDNARRSEPIATAGAEGNGRVSDGWREASASREEWVEQDLVAAGLRPRKKQVDDE
jgi:hypothetical protein